MQCEKLLREVKGIQDVLASTQSPVDIIRSQPSILVRLEPAEKRKLSRDEMMRAIRTTLEKVPTAVIRLRDISRHGYRHPVDLAVTTPDTAKEWELALKLAARVGKSKKLTDVAVDPESRPFPSMQLDVDRVKAQALGVDTKDLFNTLSAYFGSMNVNDFNRFGRTWQIVVSSELKKGDPAKELMLLQVRNKRGEMVRLGTMVSVRKTEGPMVIDRIDLHRAVFVTANLAAEITPEDARALCETEFEEARKELGLPATCRLIWVGGSASR